MLLTSGNKREVGNLPGEQLLCNSQKAGGQHNAQRARVGHAQRLVSSVLPHPGKLKIDANSHWHLTVDVNCDLSEKAPRKEQGKLDHIALSLRCFSSRIVDRRQPLGQCCGDVGLHQCLSGEASVGGLS
ncbi:hypothetical protein STEG23_011755 [Scotinomys teguina]